MLDAPTSNPLASPEAWELVSKAYVTDTLPFFERYASTAIDLAMLKPGSDILDVATGPGTLAMLAERRGHRVTAVDFAPAMLEQLKARQATLGVTRLVAELGDGQALRYEADSFDAAFSMFGLMFFADRAAGFAELLRVLRPHGTAVVSGWTQAERVPTIRALYDAIRGVMSGLAFGDGEAPIGTPAAMHKEMSSSGFVDVSVQEVSYEQVAPDSATFWDSMCRASIPLVALRKRIGEAEWPAFSTEARERFARSVGEGAVAVRWPAIVGVGHKPKPVSAG
ncbi:MAG: putative SAM-dependent methyltransferase [Myxococcaceae bacterium]|nr:putative SAM-dependent methyltransferase [Myxococcaceae bacterium]